MEIIGQDILLVKKTNLVRAYKSETEGFKGFNYRIYAYGDKAFAVHENDDFIKDLDAGNVQRIMINVTDEGYSLENYVTWQKARAHKLNEIAFESLTVENFVAKKTIDLEDPALIA